MSRLSVLLACGLLFTQFSCGGGTAATTAGATTGTSQVTFTLQTDSGGSANLSPAAKRRHKAAAAASSFEVVCFNKADSTTTTASSSSTGAVTLSLDTGDEHVCAVLNSDFETLGMFVTDNTDRANGTITTGLKPTASADLGTCTLDLDTGVTSCSGSVPAGDTQAGSTTAGVPNDLTTTDSDPCAPITPSTTLATSGLDSDGSGLPDLLDNDANGNGKCDNVDGLEKTTYCTDCDHSVLFIDKAEHYCNPGNDSYRVFHHFFSTKEISTISVSGPDWTDDVIIADSPSIPDGLMGQNWNTYNGKKLVSCTITGVDGFLSCMPLIATSGSLGDVMSEGDTFRYDITYTDSTTATAIASINMVLRQEPTDVKIEGSAPVCNVTDGAYTTIDTDGTADRFTLQFTIPAGLQVGLTYKLFCTALITVSGSTCTEDSGTSLVSTLTTATTFAGDQRTTATESQDSGVLTITSDLLPTSATNAWSCGIVASDTTGDSVDSHGYLVRKSDSSCTTYTFAP